jgi:hypothetical protein
MNQLFTTDKRKNKRFIKRCETEFVSNNISYRGITSNFSLDGLFIRTSYPFASETLLDIIIHLPDGMITRVKGRVKWALRNYAGNVPGASIKASRNGMGIEIVERDAGYMHFVSSLLG